MPRLPLRCCAVIAPFSAWFVATSAVLFAVLLAAPNITFATQTENLGIRALPAPGPVKIDGKLDDWDLSGGIFACDDVENSRQQFGMWFHLMYDERALYVAAHFLDDTPLNNPGNTSGDMGFQGDCLQFRAIFYQGTPQERAYHFTAWRGKDGKDLIYTQRGTNFKGPTTADLKTDGAEQAFSVDADGKGYVQEMALPWKLLTDDGAPLKAGQSFTITVEPNFTLGANRRLTIKDIFKPGLQPDRVFTFRAFNCWGLASLEKSGNVAPQAVRLTDAREMPVAMVSGQPAVDWSTLIQAKERLGFKPIAFTMPADGYLSLNIFDSSNHVVRQLISGEFTTKGQHEVKWDGLTTPIWRRPGELVPAGKYHWEAIYHPGLNLRLRGWAGESGSTPWAFPPRRGGWGGDHGPPCAVTSLGDHVFLGWAGAEAGRAVLSCDLEGAVQWNNTHGGIGGANLLASDGKTLLVLNGVDPKGEKQVVLYRLNIDTGEYTPWAGSDSTDLMIDSPSGLDVLGNHLFLTYASRNELRIHDAANGKLQRTISVAGPTSVKALDDTTALVLSEGQRVVRVDLKSTEAVPVLNDLPSAVSLTVDGDRNLYVGLGAPAHQVRVFDANGKPTREIGSAGGRPETGVWNANAMRNIAGIAVDRQGKLWVTESDFHPKRVSVWDSKTGKLLKEFFGACRYGAGGGTIDPQDPNIMVGEGCEWQLDPKTGKAACTGVIEHRGATAARFFPIDKRLYLMTTGGYHNPTNMNVYERVGPGDYKLRSTVVVDGKDKDAVTTFWADENDDGQQQPNEISTLKGNLVLMGYIGLDTALGPDLAIHGELRGGGPVYIPCTFTKCGAPKYDVEHKQSGPARGVPSIDNKLLLSRGGSSHYEQFKCFDLATGELQWTYPDTFNGVHGSHAAPPAEDGLIRGSFGMIGEAKLPSPVGNLWCINTNVGEWHLLNERGFYIARLFQGDPLKMKFPAEARPGALVNDAPSGGGGEDFGGALVQAADGKIYIQTGKTALWNLQLEGLENVKALAGASLEITAADLPQALALREQQLQTAAGVNRLVIKKMTPKFTGNLDQDFRGQTILRYQKQADAAAKTVAAWDEQNLYVGWDVADDTPWINGAKEPADMYLRGDTVDMQLATNANADKRRVKAVEGDLRLSIGNFQGQPTAVVYRLVAKNKHAKTFSSGVVKEYVMDSVVQLDQAKIKYTKRKQGYAVEVEIPLAALGFSPEPGKTYGGDFGVTHGGPSGDRTRLRTYWNNQHTGIVDDAVFELQMEPKNWGELMFTN